MQILAETGCYADLTFPAGAFHWAQPSKINSIYECALPLAERAPHRKGRNLARGRAAQVFPLIVQGPLMLDFDRGNGSRRWPRIDNAALTGPNPATLNRLRLWKRAAISVEGRPDWLFIKLHCHSMDFRHEEATLGSAMEKETRFCTSFPHEKWSTSFWRPAMARKEIRGSTGIISLNGTGPRRAIIKTPKHLRKC